MLLYLYFHIFIVLRLVGLNIKAFTSRTSISSFFTSLLIPSVSKQECCIKRTTDFYFFNSTSLSIPHLYPSLTAMPRINNVLECTLSTCPLSQATIDYDPTLGGNALYLSIFSLLFIIQTLQLWKYKTWSFSLSMMSGLVLEVVGYVGRVMMHFNPFEPNPFLM
jgi:hypothetical protein